MHLSKLGWAVGGIMVLGCGQATAAPLQFAQAVETNCRQTNSATGVYEQPNVNSASRGILPIAQTVQLEVLGTGTGWVRISQPTVGWVEAQYLTPAVPCESNTAEGNAASPAETTSGEDIGSDAVGSAEQENRQSRLTAAERRPLRSPDAASSDPAAAETRANSGPNSNNRLTPDRASINIAEVTSITCDVLPTYGLAVRREPTVAEDTYIDTILQGTYRFQFTRNTLSDRTPGGTRRWVYITAPIEGWISLGVVGGESTLGGDECG